MKVDYIISGQGLAGSLLSWELLKKGKSILVFDDLHQPKASDVAAGLINPVVFRRMTKSWMIDQLYPKLIKTYTELENKLGTPLFHTLPIKKILGEDDDSLWYKKLSKNQLQSYINPVLETHTYPNVHSPFGIGEVKKGGRVDIKNLILNFQKYLLVNNQLINHKLEFNKLELLENEIFYDGISAKKVIFCEGHSVTKNPFFKAIDFRHTKGEILRIRTNNYRSEFILNKAIFLMPEGENNFRIGATYNWNDLTDNPTSEAKHELQEKLGAFFTDDYQLIDHQAGIRPTTHDRRPVIGLHPEYSQIGLFNGLGSKGTMLAPYFANQFAEYLCEEREQLHPEVDIARYFGAKK